ncbi:uncharacterized protein tasor2 isoform X2 [Sander lucioperca]|uniref:uncharacterized protein tasor2 isoform X2 n=1 Tax=Sander lucioperca TaxID=283035 RepID=UPI00125DE93B|nr:uncharacterized protein tasor2 isoform X2 [Sander lucioperca]
MESGNGGASRKGVLVPVSESSGVFQNNILAPLKSAYLYEESKQSFRYTSAVLVNNPALEEKYCAFRAKRKEEGYSEEDLKESYGFLLFDDVNKANALGETGVLTGNSTCTTLGDPSKGVYIPMYSDCLDLNRWYHGKSGYIAIIRLTKGRVKKVLENYTQNLTAPTVGFDCHVSEQLPSVSAKTSSFLAFERTQYYMYELLDDGSNVTTQSPSAARPIAIVSFSYTDTKASIVASQEKSEVKNLICHYFPWRGQLQIGTLFYDVGLRSTVALIPAELPPVVKIGRAISMSDLRQLLPRAVFETCFSGEVFLDGLYFSLYELVSSEAEDTNSLPLLLREIKEKDLALTIQLNDGGFLILLHSSHFLTYDDTGSSATDVLQGMFVFPVSQVIQTDTKSGAKKPAISSEILQVLQVLNYAEGEVEKTPIDPSEELCEVLAQHMQRYAALINPGLALSPARELSIFPDQYDVPDAHKHLYSCPELTNRAWQSFRSYLSKPVSFQLPLSKASEILAPRQEERIEDLDDDVYICLSSPEEAPANPVSMESEDQLTGQRSPVNIETPVDSCITSAAAQVDVTAVPQNVVPDGLHAGDATKYTGKSDLTVLIKTDDMGAKNVPPSTSDDLPAELIVSITSAERTVTDESLGMISTVSATMHNDIQLSGFSAKLQMTGVNSLNDETVTTKKVLDCPEFTNLTKTQKRKLRRGRYKGRKRVSKACVETPSLQIPVEDDNLMSQTEDQAKESSGHPQLSNPSCIEQRKVQRRKCKFRKPSSSVDLAVAEENKVDPGQQSVESTFLMELEAFPLRKKTERWDLKPVISECGRILVPHGSLDIADQIKSLKDKIQSTKDEQTLVDASVNDTVEMEQESSTAPKTAVEETEATTSKDGGNHFQIVVSDVNPEHNILRPSDDGNGLLTLNQESTEQSSKTDGTATSPSEAVKENHTNTLSPEKIATKGDLLLSKLKSVLLRGKRKMDFLVSKEMTADTAQYTEPHLKKGKVDSDTGMLKSNYTITSVQDTDVRVKEVSKMLSVDPLFAYALGLTPKETPDKIQKTEGQDTQQRKDSSETQEQTILDKQPQIIHRPPSIFPRRGRIKMLKKHQGVSADNVKKKWWLHFQTPACYASEKLNYKECTRDNSVRKTVKEKMNSACSSTDALNLLADLALSASNDQVPPQPDPALERKPETSLKKCDLTKDVTTAEQESVLHALLRQPAARSMQPIESPSPSHLMGGSELVGLVSKEHAYSLPPSSSLLLGLPGTPFQVSPLSGSTRLLHHHQTMYGDGIKTLHPSVSQTDRSEKNHRTPEYLKKHMVCRRKFRHSRTFVDKDGSIQVTKQWKENYDFNLDSKFTNDSKDRTIVRALHGPWDFSMQDTSEEVRLIVHMWIGLFYSRSTARFFHVDSYPCSEESDSLEMPSGMVSTLAQSELKAYSFAPFLSVTDTSDPSISKALDLSKKHDSVLDQGSVVLDLSLKNINAEIVTSEPQVNRKETSVSGDLKEASETLNTLKSSMGLQEASKIQCNKKKVHYTEIVNEINDAGSTYESKRKIAGSLENTGVPSCKDDRTFILLQDKMKSVSVQPENNPTASGIGHVLHGCNNEKTDMKDGIGIKRKKAGSLEHTDVLSCKGDETFIVVQKEMESVSVPPENNPTASGIGHVLHGCNNEKTDMKDGLENKMKKAGSLEHTDVPSCKGDKTFIVVQKEMESVSLPPENNPTASGIGHVLHGCNNEKTDMKDGIENKMKKAGSLKHTDVPSCKGDETFIVVQKEMESVSVQPENNLTASGIGHVLHGCNNEETDVKHSIENKRKKAGSLEHTDGPSCKGDETFIVVQKEMESVSVPPENNPTASGIGHVLHGCNNEKTDMKDGLENKMKKAGSLEHTDGPSCKGDETFIVVQKEMESVSVQPENNLTASGIGHVLHGCNNEKTDMKVCIGNKRKKAGSLAHTDVPSCKDDETLIVVQKEMESVSVRPENQITSGIGHVLHGCNNEKTDMKDAIKKSEATAMNLVQKHGKDSSKSVTVVEVDSNKEAGNVVLTVKHDAIESKDGENLEVKESLYQQGNVEPSPKVILTDDDSTNKESGIVCNGYILENEKQLPGEEPISVSLGKAENVKDVDCCTVYKGKVIEDEDPFGKENGFDEKDSCVSPVEANSELSDQPLPINCDGPDSVKKDCITECNQKPPFDEQPPKDNNEEDACHDLQLRKLCANGSVLTDELAISEKSPHASSEMEPISNEPKNDTCLADKAHQKAALPMSDENNCSLDVSNANGSIPQTNDSVETECQNNVMANFNLISIDHEDGDTHSIEGDQKVVNTTEKELFYHQAHSPQFEAEAALTKETDLKQIEKTNEGLEKISIVGLIPFIGLDTSREDTVQQHDTHSQGKVEEVDEEEIPFISKTTYPETVQPTGLCSTSQMYSKKPELSKITGKIALSLLDVSETNQPVVSGSESDNRCPTPTMDEKPFEYLTCSGPSNTSASAFSGSETSKNMTQKCLSTGSTSRKDEVPHKSTFNSDATPHHDLELRTHRVLQSIDKFLHQTSHTKTSSQIETAEKHSLDQTPNPENKFIPTCFTTSHISSDFKDKKMQCNTTPAVVSASTSPELHTESTSNFLISPFKSKLEEVLGVKLQLKKTNSPVQQQHFERIDKLQETSVGQDCHPYISVPCTESLQAIKPNIDQGRHKTTSQSNLSHDLRSYSQRPVMAVKPSKTDECQADCISKDRQIENAVMSHFSVNKPTETPVVTYTIPTTMFLEKKTESLKENSEELNDDKQDASELSSKSSWLSNVSDSKSNSDKAKCVLQDPLKPHQGRDISKLNNIPLSSFPAQSLESAKKISKLVDGNQGFIKYSLVEKVGQTTKESIEIDQKDCSDASTSHVVYKDGGIIDDSLFLGPQSSLMCTVYNTSRKRSYSFLEQVSQRCLQDDPTEASMEQECLIFSEQMKQLLKRSKRGPICQQGTHDELNLSCTSPVTVHFCSLEEQEDSVDHLNAHFDAPSLVGQKIKVNMSDRKKTTEDDKTHPPNVSRATGNPMEHAGVSAVTSECVTLYEAMMNDVCAVKKVPSRPHKHFRIHRSYPKSEPSNHFDFCDQMKREMDESFRSNLNSVVKKSCKTKYRFYVLLTSDDAFFEETKAQLEAEGHTAVQPSEFFLGEDSSSSLLIILRNEDIAEHICEIPHLLELKKSPGAQFAGIDEPDDVVNLTHQELFTRGGFVMFDRAALESLSFCKMKKMSEILQERSRTGKWKWMLHYRDSRRLKENARLSAEAKEKKHFLNWCQEAGILEVLPYHECDLMSREQPDYLKCLVRLQVQNISARYPVFITDTTTDSAFGKNGILTMTFDSFLTYSPSKPIKA